MGASVKVSGKREAVKGFGDGGSGMVLVGPFGGSFRSLRSVVALGSG